MHARKPSWPTDQALSPVSRMLVISPSIGGPSSSSPGPVKVDELISPPATSFFMENLYAPLSEIDGDMAIMTPGLAVSGQPMAS